MEAADSDIDLVKISLDFVNNNAQSDMGIIKYILNNGW